MASTSESKPSTSAASTSVSSASSSSEKKYALIFHGGAGGVEKSVDPKIYYEELAKILRGGHKYCKECASGERSVVSVVENVVRMLEDSILFNAGRGAVLSSEGTHELEASIMDGTNLECGAVSGLTRVEHPISAAVAVMESTPHVYLTAAGAEQFLSGSLSYLKPNKPVSIVDNSFFSTLARKAEFETKREEVSRTGKYDYGGMELSPVAGGGDESGSSKFKFAQDEGETVGCVAMVNGRVAAATSTGGRAFKLPGRVGDTSMIGSGTYANNATCAVSGTGSGEEYQRFVSAYDVCARIKYAGLSVQEACEAHIKENFVEGTGGFIALDKDGRMGIAFNTLSMARGVLCSDPGTSYVSVWHDDREPVEIV